MTQVLRVLRDVSFDVREGEIVSLVGQSGCGKTTLLRCISGAHQHGGRGNVRKIEDMSAPWRAHDE